jgi:UDP-glucose 4-epimerase
MAKSFTVLVTGATGFIGRRLLEPGARSLVRRADGRDNSIVGDLLDPMSLALACKDADVVYHCGGYAHSASPPESDIHWRVNYEGTRNLLKAAGRAGVRRFVFLSSVKAMGDPGSECVDEEWQGEPSSQYGKAKRAAENEVLEAGVRYGMHVVNLRLAMVFGAGGRGNLERMVRGVAAGWFPPLPETGNRRSLVHVHDVVRAARVVVNNPLSNGKTYIVADRQAYSGREIYDAIRLGLDKGQTRWFLPRQTLDLGGRLGDLFGSAFGYRLALNSDAVEQLLGSACFLPNKIQSELGWRASVGLADGIREMCVGRIRVA